MSRFSSSPIGVALDDLRLPVKDALRRAAQMEFHLVELGATGEEVTPHTLSPSGRRHFARYVSGHGLTLQSLVADFPTLRLTDPRTADERVERTLAVLQLAADMGVPTVSASVGALTHPQSGEPSDLAVAALERIGDYADSRGVRFGIRPSHDGGERLLGVLKALNCPSLRICLDPAAMVMAGINPLASMEQLAGHITLLHARDGTSGLRDPAGGETRFGHETALGEGDVDLVGLIHALREADYLGPMILRRTESANPTSDLNFARDTLQRLLNAK